MISGRNCHLGRVSLSGMVLPSYRRVFEPDLSISCFELVLEQRPCLLVCISEDAEAARCVILNGKFNACGLEACISPDIFPTGPACRMRMIERLTQGCGMSDVAVL